MAVPGLFAPVRRKGILLVDGGIANNLPVNIVRRTGADIVIVVNLGSPLKKGHQIQTSVDVVYQMISLLGQRYIESQLASLKRRDILIIPKLENMSAADFEGLAKAIPVGAVAASALSSKLGRLSVSKKMYRNYLVQHRIKKSDAQIVHFVKIKNNSKLSDKLIRKKLAIKPGSKLDNRHLEQRIGQIYGLDVFQNVRYKIIYKDGKMGVEISAKKKEWGRIICNLA